MKNNRVYMPVSAIASHEDFELWYADGDLFLSIKGPWQSEKDKVTIFGRKGGQMGMIRPDPKALIYYLRLERWEYSFHTFRIFKSYFVKGMHWDITGTLAEPPVIFTHEYEGKREVRVTLVDDFRGRGPCYEIWCKDVAKLRIAAASVIAMAIKEEYVGLSEGIHEASHSRWDKFKRWMAADKGYTYEQILEMEQRNQDALDV